MTQDRKYCGSEQCSPVRLLPTTTLWGVSKFPILGLSDYAGAFSGELFPLVTFIHRALLDIHVVSPVTLSLSIACELQLKFLCTSGVEEVTCCSFLLDFLIIVVSGMNLRVLLELYMVQWGAALGIGSSGCPS